MPVLLPSRNGRRGNFPQSSVGILDKVLRGEDLQIDDGLDTVEHIVVVDFARDPFLLDMLDSRRDKFMGNSWLKSAGTPSFRQLKLTWQLFSVDCCVNRVRQVDDSLEAGGF